jgi:hypothetical protein
MYPTMVSGNVTLVGSRFSNLSREHIWVVEFPKLSHSRYSCEKGISYQRATLYVEKFIKVATPYTQKMSTSLLWAAT